jgi:DNA invertase Pin-like site-specific DNA recombinase
MSALLAERPRVATREVVSYERISRFRVNRDGLDTVVSRGVDRQSRDNAACADLLGLGTVARHYTDNNRSASQFATKEREQWNALLAHVRSGSVSHVLVWLFDRAARTTEATEALLAACRVGGALIVQTAGAPVIADPNSPDDIFRLKLAGLLAEYEVAKMSVRQRRSKAAAAAAGANHGGRRRFGFEPDMATLVESEAAAIRYVVARLLAGATLRECALWLNHEGMRGTSGAEFTGPNLRHLVMRPYLAGLRVHQGAVVGQADHAALIPEADHHRLVHLLSDPKRRTNMSNARRYLLAGLAVCATCGADLRGRPGTKANPDRRAYACATGRHCYRAVDDVDMLVTERTVARLERLTAAGSLSLDVDPTADELGAVDASLAALAGREADMATAMAVGTLTADAYAAATSAIGAERDRLTERRATLLDAAARPVDVLDGMTGPGAGAAWDAADLGTRRAVLDVLWDSIALRGAVTKRAPMTSGDVVLVPRIG